MHTEHSRIKPGHRILGRTLGFFSKGVDKIISDSNAVARYLIDTQRISPDKIVTIYNGVDIDRYSAEMRDQEFLQKIGIRPESKVIGTVGRLEPEKDQETLLRAFRKICDSRADIDLVIVGDGTLRNALKQMAIDLLLSDRVHFLGMRRDVHKILPFFDLFALSSKSEGFPLVVLEAMAARVPVIATAVGGIPEVVSHQVTGLLVPPADPYTLASKMALLLSEPERAASLSEGAFKKVAASYSVQSMTDQYCAVYRALFNPQ